MKKIFWITFFVFLFFICNINEIDSEDYSSLLEEKDLSSTYRINVNMNSFDLIEVLEESDVYLISVKTDNPFIDKSIVVNGESVKEQINSINNKVGNILIDKGLEEEAIYYKIHGINIISIKVFGKNESIYTLANNL